MAVSSEALLSRRWQMVMRSDGDTDWTQWPLTQCLVTQWPVTQWPVTKWPVLTSDTLTIDTVTLTQWPVLTSDTVTSVDQWHTDQCLPMTHWPVTQWPVLMLVTTWTLRTILPQVFPGDPLQDNILSRWENSRTFGIAAWLVR